LYGIQIMGEEIEVVEIVDIGKRDKEEIYRLALKRLKGISGKKRSAEGRN
jgi:hypothetical protein